VAELSVAEASRYLNVSPRRVRTLLASGRLPGRQVAGRWLVPSDAVERRQQVAPPAGRPLSPASAWRVLAVLAHADDALKGLSPPLRSRARARAAALRLTQPAEIAKQWRLALGERAPVRDFYGHPSVLKVLLDDPKIVRSGISAAHDHGADLMVLGGAEGYIRSADLAHVQERYALSPDAGPHANVRLHITEDDEAGWLFNQHLAPAAVVAADLVERDAPRDRAAGVKLASRL
jgi:excisionase family DNA binding protein